MNHTLNYRIDLQNGTFQQGLNSAISQTSQLDGIVNKVGLSLAAAFGANNLLQAGRDAKDMATNFQGLNNVIKFGSKDAADYAINQNFINKTIDEMKLPAQVAKDGYASLMASMKGSGLEGLETQKIFKGVSTAATVMGLDGATTHRAFLALTQMMSKGKVSAEELRGQLGEALPGAARYAAQAMGMTDKAFNDAMNNGNLYAKDFLPKFAEELIKVYGPGMQTALEGFRAKQNEVDNAIIQQQVSIGTKLQPAYLALDKAKLAVWETSSKLIDIFVQNEGAIKGIAIGVGLAAAAWTLNTLAIKANIWWQSANVISMTATIATTEGLAAASTYLYGVMAANPLAMVAIAVGVLAFSYGHLTDEMKRMREEAERSSWGKSLKSAADNEREDVVALGKSLEAKGTVKKGQGLAKAVNIEGKYVNSAISDNEALAATQTGAERERTLKRLEVLRSKKSALDEISKTQGINTTPGAVMPARATASVNGTGKSTSVSGSGNNSVSGGSGRGGVSIQNLKLVEHLHVHSVDGKIPVKEIEQIVTDLFVRIVHDFETSM